MPTTTVPVAAVPGDPAQAEGSAAAATRQEGAGGFADLIAALLDPTVRVPETEPATPSASDDGAEPADADAAPDPAGLLTITTPQPLTVPIAAAVPVIAPADTPPGPDGRDDTAPSPVATPAPLGPDAPDAGVRPASVGTARSSEVAAGAAGPAAVTEPKTPMTQATTPAPSTPVPEVGPTTSVVPGATAVAAGAEPLPGPAPALSDAGRQVGPVLVRILEANPARPSTHRVSLHLHPADLGEVRATLTLRDGAVHVTLAAGPAARELLRQDHPLLHHVLEQTGAERVEIAVRALPTGRETVDTAGTSAPSDLFTGDRPGSSGSSGREERPGAAPRSTAPAATDLPGTDPPAPRPAPAGRSGVDLSL
ncbi:MAG TPA: flagellar hook-length control protein FliK [Nocardioides sp.]|nr:flagellar hook-length control protein FliK [Nocardioides sp.]